MFFDMLVMVTKMKCLNKKITIFIFLVGIPVLAFMLYAGLTSSFNMSNTTNDGSTQNVLDQVISGEGSNCTRIGMERISDYDKKLREHNGMIIQTLEIHGDDYKKFPILMKLITDLGNRTEFHYNTTNEKSPENHMVVSDEIQNEYREWLKNKYVLQYGGDGNSFSTYFYFNDKLYHVVFSSC